MEKGTAGTTHVFRVLYLFSGKSRETSFSKMVQKIAQQHGLRVQVTEVDIMNDDKHDLAKESVKAGWMQQIQSGVYDVVLVTPPCSTFTRARCANKRGPPPIRSKQHPLGFPWLRTELRKQAELGNRLVDVMEECYVAAAQAKQRVKKLVLLFSEHPEDLGRVYREEDGLQLDPASIWQLESVRNLLQLDLDLFTVGFNQCCFGAPYKKPTRIISNIPGLRSWGFSGWPQFDVANNYLGPICPCGYQIQTTLVKRSNSEMFRTAGTSAYPARMDESLAQAVVLALKSMLSSPAEGGRQESIDGSKWGPEANWASGEGPRVSETPGKDVKAGVESSGAIDASVGTVSHMVSSSGANKAPVGSVSHDVSSSGASAAPEEVGESRSEARRPEKEIESIGVSSAVDAGAMGAHPLLAYYKGKHRMVHDGGGLCSPGRWPVECRKVPDGEGALAMSAVFRREFLKWLLTTGDGGKSVFWRLAGGKAVESPFKSHLEGARKAIDRELKKLGEDPVRRKEDRTSEINFRRLRCVGRALGDEDCEFLEEVAAEGVSLGVDEELPRVPGVFEEKLKWAREFTEEDLRQVWAENYSSAEECKEDIWRQVDEEVKKGTIVRLSEEEATKKFGERLAVAALGAVPKELNSEKVRLIHDGSYSVDVNRRIKVRDRMRFPLIDDASAVLLEARAVANKGMGAPRASLVYDVKGAHKLIPVKEKDWGLQAFRLPGERKGDGVYVHTRGTFGIASAAYHWQRVAAVAVRTAHRLCGRDLGLLHLLFADDGWLVSVGKYYWRPMLFWLFILEMLEMPLSWSKVNGGTKVQWIGYDLDVDRFEKGISSRKVKWVADWITTHLVSGGVMGRNLRSALGRLVFVAGALHHVRPFLGPIFAWSAVLRGGVYAKMPDAVSLLLTYIKKQIEGDPMVQVRAVGKQALEAFRIDAKAEGEKVVIGGWESLGSSDTSKARWFSMELDRRSAPWAFAKGEPFRTIAALELTAVLVAVKLFCVDEYWKGKRAVLKLTAFTDNVSNTYVLKKFLSSKFPLSIILLELATQLKVAGLEMDLGWVPRDQNIPADSLTNGIFDGFTESKRIKVDFKDLKWLVLDELMAKAGELDSEVKLAKTSKEVKGFSEKDAKVKRGETKWKDPW